VRFKKRFVFHIIILTLFLAFVSCSKTEEKAKNGPLMEVKSAAFGHRTSMPDKYTCDGADVSPPLEWRNAPSGTKTFAIICDTPDAPTGTWVHWVIYDIPADITKLPESVTKNGQLDIGAKQGKNDFDQIGYGGPCLPAGEHRFFFKLYALDGPTNLKVGASKEELLQAVKGHVLAEAELMGIYARE